jgi:hypothetical protein
MVVFRTGSTRFSAAAELDPWTLTMATARESRAQPDVSNVTQYRLRADRFC